jgi:plasmid stabilization system protein ParE
MNAFILSPEAEEDVFEIWSYLANEVNVEFADRIESKLFDAFALLSRNSGLGHKRQDLTSIDVLFYRAFPYQYMIIYRPKAPLEIVALLHARRDVRKILKDREPRPPK